MTTTSSSLFSNCVGIAQSCGGGAKNALFIIVRQDVSPSSVLLEHSHFDDSFTYISVMITVITVYYRTVCCYYLDVSIYS